MPIYEFQCDVCGKRFEKIVSLSESNRKVKCNCSPKAFAKKVISAPSFRLGGKGWYETDFKTGKKKNIASSDGAKNEKTKETSKTDSKKAAKQDKIKE